MILSKIYGGTFCKNKVVRYYIVMCAPKKYRGSHQKCSVRKGVLRNFTKFTGKHLCQSLFFNKVAGLTE